MEDNLTERQLLDLTPQQRTEILEVRLLQEKREARTEEARFRAMPRQERDVYLADLADLAAYRRGEHNVR